MLNFEPVGRRKLETWDLIGDIVKRSIAEEEAEFSQFKKSRILHLVPNNSVVDISNEKMAHIGNFSDGPTEILGKAATIKCVNCGNMAKNMVYLENYIKTNGSKKSPCTTCSTALSFLEYLNKNIQQVFNNIDNAGIYVMEKEIVLPSSQIPQSNALIANPAKPTVKEIKRPQRSVAKSKPIKSEASGAASNSKSLDKTRAKKKKPKVLKSPSSPTSVDQGSARPVRPKVKKVRKRPKTAVSTGDKSRRGTITR